MLSEMLDAIYALPEVTRWPEMKRLVDRMQQQPYPALDLTPFACMAVGGEPQTTAPAVAAVACMHTAIILIDDMLDDDPRGEYRRLGHGAAANLASAFQAAAFRLTGQLSVDAPRRALVVESLSGLGLATAWGQQLDIELPRSEENYWRVMRAKSPPFFGTAAHLGALLGGTEPAGADQIRRVGLVIGEMVQMHDDLMDAFATPANPDWLQARNNLAIIYGLTAEHPGRARLRALLPSINEESALAEAQAILRDCGAISYCAYHLIRLSHEIHAIMDALVLADPAPLLDVLQRYDQPVANLLASAGVENAESYLPVEQAPLITQP